jgi:hypothetical protein
MAVRLNRDELESVLRDLAATKRLIVSGWCQGSGVQDSRGIPVETDSKRASKFSLTAAVYRATDAPSVRFYRIIGQMKPELIRRGFRSLGQLNDSPGTTYSTVIDFISCVALDISTKLEDIINPKDTNDGADSE